MLTVTGLRKMQTKPTMSYYRYIRMAKIKMIIPTVVKNVGQLTFPHFAGGTMKWHNGIENCIVVSYQVKHIPTIWPNNSTLLNTYVQQHMLSVSAQRSLPELQGARLLPGTLYTDTVTWLTSYDYQNYRPCQEAKWIFTINYVLQNLNKLL